MNDIRREKIPVSQLDIGMFVSELDRPWLGTPFMLEGLLIEDSEQIAIMASLCEYVYIDRTVSVGNHFTAPPKDQVAIKPDGAIIRISSSTKPNKNLASSKSNHSKEKSFSFFDVLKEIKESNQNSAPTNGKNGSGENNLMFNAQTNLRNDNITNSVVNFENDSFNEKTSFVSQIKSDFTNFISALPSWVGSQKKLKSSIDKNALKADASKNIISDDGYRITIFETAPPVEEEIAHIYPVYEKSQIATREIFEALAEDREINLTNVIESITNMVESIERNPDALIWLSKLKQTDNHAYNHALNVSIMMMALANFMAMPKKQIKELGFAGLLQDIGKAKISPELLHKQEKITAEEFNVLKKHVDHALTLLEVTDNISGTVILTISQHHERIDGSGYPYQLTGKQISLTGQMAGLIDTYCALTSNKVYAKGVYNQLALEKIHALRDTKFNGALIDQLVQFLGIYPVSTLVELNSGEVGVVIQQNSVRRMLPRVMLLLNPDKTKNETPATVDLIHSPKTPTGEPYQILRGLAPDSYGLSANNFYA
ncbi:MAG TPA: HD-GYP domain-containing protein [Methylotenera sp.]|nr:HD-GYP domain-containing protein [Methylotenera sp.]